MGWFQSTTYPAGLLATLGGIALLYAAAQSLAGTISRRLDGFPGWRALWHSGPVAAAALVAAGMGHGDIALGILTGASVAILSLAPGVCNLLATSAEDYLTPNVPFGLLLAPTLVLWLIGLRAEINWLAGIFLATQGLLLTWIWSQRNARTAFSRWMIIAFLLATAVAGIAAVLAIQGGLRLRADLATLTPAVLASAMLAPILILPALGESVRLTDEHRAKEARQMQTASCLINLTGILPACVALSYLRRAIFSSSIRSALNFPIGTWRIDCVVLIILAAWMSSGIPLPTRARKVEGICLIILYGAYLISLARIEIYL